MATIFLGFTNMVKIKSPSQGLDGSINNFYRSLAIPRFMISLSPDEKVICLGLVACTGLQCPSNSMWWCWMASRITEWVVTAFQFVMWSLTQPALKLRTSWDSKSASTIDVTCSLTLSFIDPSGLECVVWCGHPLVPGCWLKNAFGNLSSVWQIAHVP